MANQVGTKFAWVIKDFSSLQCEKCYSLPVQIGDCKWRLFAYPKGFKVDYLSLFLEVVDFESLPPGWRRYVKLWFSIAKQVSEEPLVMKAQELSVDDLLEAKKKLAYMKYTGLEVDWLDKKLEEVKEKKKKE